MSDRDRDLVHVTQHPFVRQGPPLDRPVRQLAKLTGETGGGEYTWQRMDTTAAPASSTPLGGMRSGNCWEINATTGITTPTFVEIFAIKGVWFFSTGMSGGGGGGSSATGWNPIHGSVTLNGAAPPNFYPSGDTTSSSLNQGTHGDSTVYDMGGGVVALFDTLTIDATYRLCPMAGIIFCKHLVGAGDIDASPTTFRNTSQTFAGTDTDLVGQDGATPASSGTGASPGAFALGGPVPKCDGTLATVNTLNSIYSRGGRGGAGSGHVAGNSGNPGYCDPIDFACFPPYPPAVGINSIGNNRIKGGQGGSGGGGDGSNFGGIGGAGGGRIILIADDMSGFTGRLISKGSPGSNASAGNCGGGGGGGGGTIIVYTKAAASPTIIVTGGAGGNGSGTGANGNPGGNGYSIIITP